MVKWPEHTEPVREDELYLFAYCCTRWDDDPFHHRKSEEYEQVVKALNERFSSRFGTYSVDAVRRYLQHLTERQYLWPYNSRKRYHQFRPQIEEYIAQHPAVFGVHPRSVQRTPIGAKRMQFLEA